MTTEDSNMKELELNVYMTTQNPSEPDDDGDREQQDEDHSGSGHQQ